MTSIKEHERNICAVLQALHEACLYVSPDKTHLFCMEINLLGHHISVHGIKEDSKKVNHILVWPVPKSATETHLFLGLVWYIAAFLPALADHTGVLMELTTKDAEK